MTDTFQFRNNTLNLNLSNHTFSLTVDENVIGICDSIRQEAKEYLLQMKDDNSNADAGISEICLFFERCIDRILGEGATDTVFGTRPKKLFDLTDLLSYILGRIGKVIEHHEDNTAEE